MRLRPLSAPTSLVLVAAVLATPACAQVLGLGSFTNECGNEVDVPDTCKGGGGHASSSASTSGTGGGTGGAGGAIEHCSNGKRDADETDIDCGGGQCMPCADGKGCQTGADCKSLSCPAHTCVPTQCGDMIQNGQETDVDCGGPSCPPCANDGACKLGRDCASNTCLSKKCVPWATSISAGGYHTCALTVAGGVKCWGQNLRGQLGNDSTTDSHQAVDVVGLSSPVTSVSAGYYHTCAVTTAGGVVCWGINQSGQLGDGSTTSRTKPVAVIGLASSVSAVSAGDGHTCALLTGGGVECWGSNGFGQLGDATTTDSPVPVAVSGLSTGIAGVSAGDYHACAWDSAGALKCWGSNSHGQLGDNSATDSDVPVLVNGLSSSVAAAVAGSDDACALTGSGTMKCWGFNTQGQLGDNAITESHVPVDVQGLTTAVSAIAANGHSCALGIAGDIHCWGWNAAGQLGDGSTTDRHLPVAVSALSSGVVAVSAGGEHTCALMKSGDVRCWGLNADGQLGDGTGVDSHVPVNVLEPPTP